MISRARTGLLIVLMMAYCCQALSQILGEESFSLELRKRVNSIESFINRFNNREDMLGNMKPADSMSDKFVADRTRSILSLFDHDRFRKLDDGEKDDFVAFINLVNDKKHQVCLDFYDSNWYAAVDVEVLYRKESREMTLFLKVEQTEPRVSKWTLCGVRSDFLRINRSKNDTINIIPPNSHGNDFVGLPGNLSKPTSIADLTSKDTRFDELSIFLYAYQRGDVEIKMARRVSYYFLQIPQWVIKVREFNRSSENSGWLVEELTKADDQVKNSYKEQFLSLNR